ncbi:MAG: MoaD/ThiS family protein [Dehalococcoidales bacterium]|nr:MoaD/ThiS family protein [Dehalococcoidales bacterium]
MSITAVIPGGLRVFTGDNENIEVQGSSIGECLEDLASQYPAIENVIFFEKGKLFNFGTNRIYVFLNGEDARPNELEKPVKDGDTINIMLAISGG